MSIGKSGQGTGYSFLRPIGSGSDVGCRRPVNEDSYKIEDTLNGFAVVICDGMGGYVGGKVASETAVEAILRHLKEHQYDNPKAAIDSAIREANRSVLRKAELRPELAGMGCTCVLLLVSKSGEINFGHVGDSRIYRLSNGGAIQRLTKDQSYVQILVDEGVITPQEAERHPRNNEITNAVGMRGMTPPVIGQTINPVAGDCFLLCSDGLSKLVSEEDITRITGARSYGTQERVKMLIEAAKSNGGSDNISVILVEFAVNPNEAKKDRENKRLRNVIYALIGIILLAVLSFFLIRTGKKEDPAPPTVKSEQENSIPAYPTPPNSSQISDTESATGAGNGNDNTSSNNGSENKYKPVVEQGKSSSDTTIAGSVASQGTEGNENGVTSDITFEASKDSLKVPRNKSLRVNYSEKCANKPDEDPRNDKVEIKKTPDGYLRIIKTDKNVSWAGYCITINKYLDKAGEIQDADKPIKIVFE